MSTPASSEALLIPDTCALLDILRSCVGQRDQGTSLRPFLLVRDMVGLGEATIVVPEIVVLEWGNNVDGVRTEAEREASRCLEGVSGLVAGRQGLPPSAAMVPSPQPHLLGKDWASGYVGAWVDVVDQLIGSARIEPKIDDDLVFGMKRSIERLPPCARPGESPHDGAVLAAALRAAGAHDGPSVFVSSNTKDFCGEDNALHPELTALFDSSGLSYARSWGEAFGQIR